MPVIEIEVPDIPRKNQLELPRDKSALLIVDMQNDFAHDRGALAGESARAIVPVIAGLLAKARAAGVKVIFTQDWHHPGDPEFALWGEHAKAGSWGAEIIGELSPRPEEIVLQKPRYDAFYGTPLDHLLRSWRTEHLVITGTVANICVLHTAGSAALRWYRVVIPEDAVAALTSFDKRSALRQITFLYRGVVTTAAGIRFT